MTSEHDDGYPAENTKAVLVKFEDLPVNHDEAFLLASMKQMESNLARCYLDLKAQLADYQKPTISMVCCA